jgi:hypothetical protein
LIHERNVAKPGYPGLQNRPGSIDAHLYCMQICICFKTKGMQITQKKIGLEQK